jgi:integrase
MTVRKRKWKTKDGQNRTAYFVHVETVSPDGEPFFIRRTPELNTAEAARNLERRIRNEIEAGTYRKPSRGETFDAVADAFLRDHGPHIGATTRAIYTDKLKLHLRPEFGSLAIRKVEEKIPKFTRTMLQGHTPGGVNAVLRVLKSVLRYAYGREQLRRPPVVKMVTSKDETDTEESRSLTAKELKEFLAEAKQSEREWFLALLVLAKTGVRIGEAAALQAVRDLDLNSKRAQVHVRERIYKGELSRPKSGKGRSIPIGPTLLRELKKVKKEPGELLFRHPVTGKFLDQDGLKWPIARVCERIGLEPFGAHTLRRTFGSLLVQKGVPIATVSKLMGHSSVTVTERSYIRHTPHALAEAVAVLG